MATIIDIQDIPQHMVMRDVSWSYYEQTLKEIGDQGIRISYLDGVMELMSPLPEHEELKQAIGALILNLAIERRIPYKPLGSSTFRYEERYAGAEPDECFYFHELESVRGMKRFDPAIHRAPDLWVEVDYKSRSVPREPIYARLGVPELWRYASNHLAVRLLSNGGRYVDSPESRVFPFLPIPEFAGFIPKMVEGDQLTTVLEFRNWVRSLPQA